ncbi:MULTISPECIES: dihydrodipicolinate synthase family protein [unclassified Nocardioides]|uniref:dihydrodipicolinate synthase family protein n=1 Tax=unclassified Nocardioides TaxID=2615069 RepID=UPI0036208CEF
MTTTRETTAEVLLPAEDGTLYLHRLGEPRHWPRPTAPFVARKAYAAAHVVPRSLGDNVPGAPADLDWDATLAARHRIWASGLGVAEVMDTAQRGMGLDWSTAAELARRTAAEARSVGGAVASGAGTDHLDLASVSPGDRGLATVLAAYRAQLEVVLDTGATPVLMASRALAAAARGPEDYAQVYGSLLAEVDRPVILHWLGEMFDSALRGYWGAVDVDAATETFVGVVNEHAAKIDGVKVSLLDQDHEVRLRGQLPEGVRLYTGDDFHYPDLVVGDEHGHSDALLGVFAAIHPAASAALQALDRGDRAEAHAVLTSTVELGRHIFAAPTSSYKTGIAFLAWLDGHQDGFAMVGGLQSYRSVPHLVRLFRLADEAGLLVDPGLAAHRMGRLLEVAGVNA